MLSVMIAVFAAYTALNLLSRLNDRYSTHLFRTRIGAGGLVLGLGIWSMHFVAMLAYTLPMPVRYDGAVTLWSLVVAVAACIIGLAVAAGKKNHLRISLGGICLGLGIVSMHYIGMAAMRMPASMHYNPWLVAVSILIGIGAAVAAIWMAFAIGRGEISATLRFKAGSSLLMGTAIAGMHYTGMAAMTVYQNGKTMLSTPGFELDPVLMGGSLTVSSILLMSFALWSARLVAEANLVRANEERVRAITENVVDVIITINTSGIIEFANGAVERVFGYKPAELLNANVNILMPEPWHSRHDGYIKKYLADGDSKLIGFGQSEFHAVHKDGSTFPIDLSISETVVDGKRIFIGTIRDISERIETQKRLHYLAHHDVLTTLPNRLSFQEHIRHALTHARRRDSQVAVMFMDVDRFKLINDTLGHHVGDFLLQEIALRLKECIREGDVVARLSGDEFTVLLEDITTRDEITPIAKKLITSFTKPFIYNEQELFSTASIGISIYPDDGADPALMMRHADIAMYSAKADGGNRYHFYTTAMNARADERLQLETSLRHALEREEFVLYYQPQIDTATGMITAVEALLRWQHPQLGLVQPLEFINILEETGLIVPVGEWVIKTACRQHITWLREGVGPLRIAVNLSARQFNEIELVQQIDTVLRDTGMQAHYLELEITENTLIQQTGRTMQTITELHALGVQLAIDDFGTGYSSLSYLRKIPIHTLKIDRSFVRDIINDPDDAAIVQLILDMAHSLKLNVVAEGVENNAQQVFLTERQCHSLQGYHFSQPLPETQLRPLLLEGVIGVDTIENKKRNFS